MMNDREFIAVVGVGVIAFMILYISEGIYGILNFFMITLISIIGNAFFFIPIINVIVKGHKNVNVSQTIVMMTVGFIFVMMYVLILHKTPYGLIVDITEKLITILIIYSIVNYIKKEMEKITR